VAVEGDDVFAPGGSVVEGAAKDGDVLGEVGFFDELVGPDFLAEFGLGEDSIPVLDEDEKSLKDLGCERDGVVTAGKFAAFSVEDVFAELKRHFRAFWSPEGGAVAMIQRGWSRWCNRRGKNF